jgi:glycosyltransferase involved in cell wall biosynthesis
MKISIITATYNSAATVADCILSVNNQTFQNIEHIIIDGGSTDNTIQIVKDTPNRISQIVSEPDKGIYDAMNKGIMLAKGDIIGILNSDDLYQDNLVLEKIAGEFETKKVDCVYADLYYVSKSNTDQVIRHWKTRDYIQGAFKRGWHPAHPTFFVKREVYEKYGLFNLDFNLAADFELMLRLLEHHKISSSYLPQPIVRMRLGGATGKNIQNIIKQNIECYKAFGANGIKVSPLYPLLRLLPKLKQFFNKQ